MLSEPTRYPQILFASQVKYMFKVGPACAADAPPMPIESNNAKIRPSDLGRAGRRSAKEVRLIGDWIGHFIEASVCDGVEGATDSGREHTEAGLGGDI